MPSIILLNSILCFIIIIASICQIIKSNELKYIRKIDSISNNKVTLYFNNESQELCLFVCSYLSCEKNSEFYKIYLLQNNNSIDITSSISVNPMNVADLQAFYYNVGDSPVSPIISIIFLKNFNDLSLLFYNNKAYSIIFDENFDSSKVLNMYGMFRNCQKLTYKQ